MESDTIVKCIRKLGRSRFIELSGSFVVGEKVLTQIHKSDDGVLQIAWLKQDSEQLVAEGGTFIPKVPGDYSCLAKLFDSEGALLKVCEVPF